MRLQNKQAGGKKVYLSIDRINIKSLQESSNVLSPPNQQTNDREIKVTFDDEYYKEEFKALQNLIKDFIKNEFKRMGNPFNEPTAPHSISSVQLEEATFSGVFLPSVGNLNIELDLNQIKGIENE